MPRLTIVSGGQTGVDRAALDTAIKLDIAYAGWCPRGGWAEDMPEPPGLLRAYPELTETPSADTAQRSEWNVRDSDATLILTMGEVLAESEGTAFTIDCAERLQRPYLLVDLEAEESPKVARRWLTALLAVERLNCAGPRESEVPGIYERARRFLEGLLAGADTAREQP